MSTEQLVLAVTAPLLVVMVALALLIRRHGSTLWALGIMMSWVAAGCLAIGGLGMALAIGFGAGTTCLFLAGARQYEGRATTRAGVALLFAIPVVLTLLELTAGPPWGQSGMALCDTLLLGACVSSVWPRGAIASLTMARLLPWGVIAFIPANLYYQASVIAGASLALPTVTQTLSLVLLSAMFLLALSARIARDETLERQFLEDRVRDQADALMASEEKARAAERLAAVGTFAAGIAHQLNNPVGGILAAAQFELADAPRLETQDGPWRALRTIEREALRCGRIVRNVLLFARGGGGTLQRHDLNALVAGALDATRDFAKVEGASIDFQPGAAALPVRANAVELEQVFVNLIVNAIESGQRVRVRIASRREGAEAVCRVQDDGEGVQGEVRDRLFEPFYSTKTDSGGSGLGLSVVHGIVTRHGGTVEFEDAPGGGSRFRVRLPLVDRDASGDCRAPTTLPD